MTWLGMNIISHRLAFCFVSSIRMLDADDDDETQKRKKADYFLLYSFLQLKYEELQRRKERIAQEHQMVSVRALIIIIM
jgi:hypothetical protein